MRRLFLAAMLATCCASAQEPSHTKGQLVPLRGVSESDVLEATRPKRIALLFGVDHFLDAFWPALRYAGKDAQDLGAALSAKEIGAFDAVEVIVAPERTTKAGVLAAVDRLSEIAPRAEDTVVLYLSAHGTLALGPEGARRFLVLSDTRHESLDATGLALDELAAHFDRLPSKRKVLVLATCTSGGGKSLLLPEVERSLQRLKGPAPMLEEVSRASLVLSASDFGQAAREDDRLANDVYTHFLLEALAQRADADGDGAVSATEAHDYARRRTFEFTGGLQIPTIQSLVVGADPIFLAGHALKKALPVLYSYAPSFEGFEVLANGHLKGVLPGNVVLEPGDAEIELKRGSQSYHGARDLALGDRVSAEQLVASERRPLLLRVSGGALGLLGSSLGSTILRPLAGASAAVHYRDALWTGADLLAEIMISYSDQTVRPVASGPPVPQAITAFQAGVGATWGLPLGSFRPYAGPHLSYLLINRSLSLTDFGERQLFGAWMPGLVLGTELRLVGRIALGLEGQIHYLPLVLDGQTRSVLTGSLSAGVGVEL